MSRDKVTDALIEALKQALGSPGEQRLYKSGKLDGLFPGRAGASGEAAAFALREGLLEVVRTEARGKSSFAWVRLTPKGVEFLHEHDSPVRALQELQAALRASREALPAWLEAMRQELRWQADRLEESARQWSHRLEALGRRVEEALRRLEEERTELPEDLIAGVPWAPAALDYLDKRRGGVTPPLPGGPRACTFPELFEALQRERNDLSVSAFHDGLRRLQERRAVRLLPAENAETLLRPEFALFDGSRVLYSVAL